MPSQILHTLFGEDVIEGLYRRVSPRFGIVAGKALEKIRDYHGAFALGCQGPDIFYHSRRRRPVALEYGSLLHRRGYGVFTAELLRMSLPDPPPDEDDIRGNRREKGINALGVYALGFMTHAVLDRFCHPYIVYKTWGLDRIFHPFFERILDALMLKTLRGQDAAAWDQAAILADICEKPPLGLRELLARALAAVFPGRAGKDRKLGLRVDNAFLDAAWFYRLTSPARAGPAPEAGFEDDPKFLACLYPEQLPGDIDFLNLARRPWYYPRYSPGGLSVAAADTRSFPEIYAGAREAALDSLAPGIIRYLDTGIFPIQEAARAIGNGGLSIQDGEGRPCAPNFGEALPLDRVLRQQAGLRGCRLLQASFSALSDKQL
ncbi:MAG: zinc dependent phospholipase C family protein [Treponema sp.]|jgi:hypothetical protein|nr:zinc dependent phospholipase C family protein [Treponema sp.]